MLLREKDREELQKLFETIAIPVEVIAYGSRVNGTAHEASDLDLVIRTQNHAQLDREVFATLVEKIKDSNIPILVELRDWATLPASFHKQIEKNCRIIYSSI